MARIIDGKAIAAQIRAEIAAETAALKEQGITPGLAVILVGDDPASHTYVRNKQKACAEVGFYGEQIDLPTPTSGRCWIRWRRSMPARISTAFCASCRCPRRWMRRR